MSETDIEELKNTLELLADEFEKLIAVPEMTEQQFELVRTARLYSER